MSFVKHITQSNLNFEIKNRLNFNDFLWQAIFEIFQIRTKYDLLDPISSYISFYDPSFVTIKKPLSNKTGKTFSDRLK